MAIVKMRKLHLVALAYEKDAVLDALQRTNAVGITAHAHVDNTYAVEGGGEQFRTELASVEAALSALSVAVETFSREQGERLDVTKDGFDVTYTEFMSAKDKRERIKAVVDSINALTDERNGYVSECTKLASLQRNAEIYSKLKIPFDAFKDTPHTIVRLGVVPATAKDLLAKGLDEIGLCAYDVVNATANEMLVYVTAHKSVLSETESVLSLASFTKFPYTGVETGETLYKGLLEKERALQTKIEENQRTVYAMKDEIRSLKIYCDYLNFLVEKEDESSKLRATERTFLMQAYVPETAEELVEQEIKASTSAVIMEFSDPTDEDEPPTLLKNNGIVSNFEGITNTYSPPNYREFDPNAVMAFFYSLFMGFIIGDAGYGLMMLIGGGYLWLKNLARPTGMSRLAGAFAIGGIFAVIWGLLFNSLFGFAVLPTTVMPNPQSDMWSLAGISVPSVLIISMLIGVVQICAGYLCKAVQEWRRGGFFDGLFDGILWLLFSLGVGLAILGFTEEFGLPSLQLIGGATAGVSLLLAMLTAGRKEKLVGKFTKGFGAAYGVINFASDILSYARLYGLMLSGAVIAQIIATYSGQFIVSGNIAFAVLGVVLLIVGNVFNLVMNLLGAYIHDARLQYVEFYGRFFEGEGELFVPLGSKQQYVHLLPATTTD